MRLELLFVRLDVARPLVDRLNSKEQRLNATRICRCDGRNTNLFLADPDLLGYLTDQPEIVTHKNHSAVELIDGIRKSVDGLRRDDMRLNEWM